MDAYRSRRVVVAAAGLLAVFYAALTAIWLGGWPALNAGQPVVELVPLRTAEIWLGALGVLGAALGLHFGLRRRRRSPSPADHAATTTSYSVRSLLALLSLATALPLLFLLAYHVRETKHAEVAEANQLVAHLANITASDVEATVRNFERVAAILAQRPLLRELDPARCDPRLDELKRTYPVLANVGTVDVHGQAICSAVPPRDGRMPHIGNPSWLAALRRTNGFVIGAPQRGLYTGRSILVLAYPIRDNDRNVTGAAQLVLFLDQFLPLVTKALPEGGVAGILNSEGTIVARSPNPESTVGSDVRGSAVSSAILERKRGTVLATGLDGVERFYAFQPVDNAPWFSVVGIPTGRIYAEARHNAWSNGLLSLGGVVFSLILALLIHRKIAAPMLDLRGAAQRVASGEIEQRAPVAGPREVAEVATGFNQMLDKLLITEDRLHASEAQYRMLFETSPDAIRVICDNRIVMLNPAGFHLFGITEDQLASVAPVFDFIHPSFREHSAERLRQVIEERRVAPAEERKILRADGSEVEVEVVSLPVTYQGRPAALSIIHDLTARKAAEQAIRRLNAALEERVQARTAELQRANEELEAFSYTIAHDLRAPLRAMNGFSRLLLESQGERLDADGKTFVDRILASSLTMNDLLEGLLKLTHLGRVEPVFATVDLSLVAQSVIDQLGAAEPGRRVATRVQPGLTAHADLQLIRDVLENLIGNAWKYTSQSATPLIEFGAMQVDGGTAYFVRDNGAGFDEQYAGKLFKTFQRLHSVEQFAGTGIGLASVKRIVEHHQGKVWARGEVGRGATFYFTLGMTSPVAPPGA